MQNDVPRRPSFFILHFAFCICLIPMITSRSSRHRTGGVYIAVLGTALVISVLGMSAMVLQRLQNRQLSATGEMRQAQLNAETAVDLALLTLKQDTNWRTTYTNGTWFSNRSTGNGT